MISYRYLKFVLMAIIASSVTAVLMYPSYRDMNIWIVALSTAFAIPFMSLVVRRLPVFKAFYKQDDSVLDDGIRSSADQKASAPMASIVTGAVIVCILMLFGVSNLVVPAFCGAVAAGVMSFYHWPF